MPGRARVIQQTLGDADVLKTFNSVLGGDEPHYPAAWPKYLRMEKHARRFLGLLDMLRRSAAVRAALPGVGAGLEAYLRKLRGLHAASFCAPDLARHVTPQQRELMGLAGMEVVPDFDAVPEEELQEFARVFEAAKRCDLANLMLETCSNLVAHKRVLAPCPEGESAALHDRRRAAFLRRLAGPFCPLPDCGLDFRALNIDCRLPPEARTFVVDALCKMYEITHDMYEALSAPDIDVDGFVSVIEGSLKKLNKVPGMSRCKNAIRLIQKSVGMLRDNFGRYYRDFVSSNNPAIIMESFVGDIAHQQNATPALAAEFRTIISHYRKAAQQRSSMDPQMAKVLGRIEENFKVLGQRSRAAEGTPADDAAPEAGPPDDETPDDAAPVSAAARRRERQRIAARGSQMEAQVAAAAEGMSLAEALDLAGPPAAAAPSPAPLPRSLAEELDGEP